MPREAAPPPRSEPQLNAISQQDGQPVAVIDGRLVREGDSVDGVRVLRIGETEVEVEVRRPAPHAALLKGAGSPDRAGRRSC